MGMLTAPVEARDLKVDYICKLWGPLVPGPAGEGRGVEFRTPAWGRVLAI